MHTQAQTLAFLPNVGWVELTVIGIILLLLFGRRLPEVGRSLGQGIVEFKKGLKDVTDDIKTETNGAGAGTGSASGSGSKAGTEAPKFESAKPPNGPDVSGTAHTSSTRIPEHAAAEEPPKND